MQYICFQRRRGNWRAAHVKVVPVTREAESYLETRGTLRTAIQDYGSNRPHSSLDYRTPEEFAREKKEGTKA